MAYTHWSDVMGNYISAKEVVEMYHSKPGRNTPDMAHWLEQQSKELWGKDHRDEDWLKMEKEIRSEAK